jgi:hypothetical protein
LLLHLQMKDEALDGNKAAAEAAAQRGNMLMNALWSIVGGGRAAESAGTASAMLHERAAYE